MLEEGELAGTYSYSTHKHRPPLSQIKINLHIISLFTSVSITQYIMSGFQQKVTSHAKGQENTQSEEAKQASLLNSDTIRIL